LKGQRYWIYVYKGAELQLALRRVGSMEAGTGRKHMSLQPTELPI